MTEDLTKSQILDIAAERRKSNRIQTKQSILKKRPKIKEQAEGQEKKRRPRQNKVTFGGSLANPEFQGIINTAAQ